MMNTCHLSLLLPLAIFYLVIGIVPILWRDTYSLFLNIFFSFYLDLTFMCNYLDCIEAIDGTYNSAFVYTNDSTTFRNRQSKLSENVVGAFKVYFMYLLVEKGDA